MRISDWSSDVCSSDLLWDWWNGIGGDGQGVVIAGLLAFVGVPWTLRENARRQREMVEHAAALQREALLQKFDNERRLEGVWAAVIMREDADRKSGVWGTSVSGRLDFGGGRIVKKTNIEESHDIPN